MADVREMRIFEADQIVVHSDLPSILKDYSKEVIRTAGNQSLVKFSKEYFEGILKAQGYDFEKKRGQPAAPSIVRSSLDKIEDHYELKDRIVEDNLFRKSTVASHKKSGAERVVYQRKVPKEDLDSFRNRIEVAGSFCHKNIL